MPRIHQLSATLANQISAGEVVERPASVVKELVENSIDAGSKDIDVYITGSGLSKIKVVDDGCGIEHDDVKTAFKRHATSKIQNKFDLFKIGSLGFRGEALPSIASVADVTLRTSTGQQGTQIHIDGGKLKSITPAQARRGTSVTVKNLFFNTPARLKYMKTQATELAKISNIVDRLALGHPKIAFSLVHNNREMLRTAGRGSLLQVIGSIYGINKVKKLLPIKASNDDFKIWGYFSLPELTRASRSYISTLINGRYVENLNLSKAVVKGYGSRLMVGRYPIAVINIKANPFLIDPNVHPTKMTVRVDKEPELCELISHTIMKKLAHKDLIPDAMNREDSVAPKQPQPAQLNLGTFGSSNTQSYSDFANQLDNNDKANQQSNLDTDTGAYNNSNNQVGLGNPFELPSDSKVKPVVIKTKDDLNSKVVQDFDNKYTNEDVKPFSDVMTGQIINEKPNENPDDKQIHSQQKFPKLTYLAQLHGTYLLCGASDGLYIIDQHAAQERINYSKFRTQIGKVSADEQDLLVPIILNYSTSDVLEIKNKLNVLKSIGINLESFGPDSFVLHECPTWIKSKHEKDIIEQIIEYVLHHKHISIAQFRNRTAKVMSCKYAIKANQHLDRIQAQALIKHLSQCQNPFFCVHGRPTIVHFSNYDMQKMFKRVQQPHKTDLWKGNPWHY